MRRKEITLYSRSKDGAVVNTRVGDSTLESVQGKEEVTEDFLIINGRVDRFRLRFYDALPEGRLECYTSDGELVFTSEGNEGGIIRPRVSPITQQNASFSAPQREQFAEDRWLRFFYYNAGEEAVASVEVVYDA